MNNEMITVEREFSEIASILQIEANAFGNYDVKAVDSRYLQKALGSTKDHTQWVKAQIERSYLVENQDYSMEIMSSQTGTQDDINSRSGEYVPQVGRPTNNYAFTVEAAKMVVLSSRTKKARRLAEYFMAMERVAHKAMRDRAEEALSPSDALRLVDAMKEIEFKAKHPRTVDTSVIRQLLPSIGIHGFNHVNMTVVLVEMGIIRRVTPESKTSYIFTRAYSDTGLGLIRKCKVSKYPGVKGAEVIAGYYPDCFDADLRAGILDFVRRNEDALRIKTDAYYTNGLSLTLEENPIEAIEGTL